MNMSLTDHIKTHHYHFDGHSLDLSQLADGGHKNLNKRPLESARVALVVERMQHCQSIEKYIKSK